MKKKFNNHDLGSKMHGIPDFILDFEIWQPAISKPPDLGDSIYLKRNL